MLRMVFHYMENVQKRIYPVTSVTFTIDDGRFIIKLWNDKLRVGEQQLLSAFDLHFPVESDILINNVIAAFNSEVKYKTKHEEGECQSSPSME